MESITMGYRACIELISESETIHTYRNTRQCKLRKDILNFIRMVSSSLLLNDFHFFFRSFLKNVNASIFFDWKQFLVLFHTQMSYVCALFRFLSIFRSDIVFVRYFGVTFVFAASFYQFIPTNRHIFHFFSLKKESIFVTDIINSKKHRNNVFQSFFCSFSLIYFYFDETNYSILHYNNKYINETK